MLNVESLFEKKPNGESEKVLKVISRSGMSSILFSLDRKPLRFSQLMFETKLNPGILDRHLKALMQLRVIDKTADSYQLTETGKKLVRILEQLFTLV